MPDLISRRVAVSLRLRRFYTGRPCKYDHDSERYVSSGQCIACASPKPDAAAALPAVEQFTFPNGRIVSILTQEQAVLKGWSVYFTGQPCNEGHMSERNTKDGRCLQCMHPPKYAPGSWPFSPTPTLHVPRLTSPSVWTALTRKIQDAIPRFLQELAEEGKSEPIVAPREDCHVHGILHSHHPGTAYATWNGYILWWPFPLKDRPPLRGVALESLAFDTPWTQVGENWYAIYKDGSLVAIEPNEYESYDPNASERLAAQRLAEIVEEEDDEAAHARRVAESRKIMER